MRPCPRSKHACATFSAFDVTPLAAQRDHATPQTAGGYRPEIGLMVSFISLPSRLMTAMAGVPGLMCPAARNVSATVSVQRPHSRSEEHTSELQSHLNIVCRLLLEKKN